MTALARVSAKPEGGAIAIDSLSSGGEQSKTEWVELCYDPDDEYDLELAARVRLLIDMNCDKSQVESLVRSIAHTYLKQEGF